MNLKIRKATVKDLELIVNLWSEFRDVHTCIIVCQNDNLKPHTKLKKNAKKLFSDYLKKHLESKDAYVQIAYVDNKVAGYNLSFIKDNIPIFELSKLGNIGDLYVKKEYRGLGIASKMKENALKWFKRKGVTYASIQVWAENPNAHAIYKKWGFKDIHVEMRKKL